MLQQLLKEGRLVLTEGGITERLKHEFLLTPHEKLHFATLVFSEDGRAALRTLYEQYISIAEEANLPILLMVPTRKVNYRSIAKTGYDLRELLQRNIDFIEKIRNEYGLFSKSIFIGGTVGCLTNAYAVPDTDVARAEAFHSVQLAEFENSAIDFVYASIIPCIDEALGIAKAAAKVNKPYLISFMIRSNGRLLDGTSVHDAIMCIDQAVANPPLVYTVNCIHPQNVLQALANPVNQTETVAMRLKGIQSNASMLSPEHLDNCKTLQIDDFDELVNATEKLLQQNGFKIIGGCCGTDQNYLKAVVRLLKAKPVFNC